MSTTDRGPMGIFEGYGDYDTPEPVPATNQAGEVNTRQQEEDVRNILNRWSVLGRAEREQIAEEIVEALATQPAASQDVEAAVQSIVAATGGKCWKDPGAVEALRIAFKTGRESVSLSQEGGR